MSATKPITDEQMRTFALNLTRNCEDHASWLTVARYGLGFLLEDQSLLIEVVSAEAARMTAREGPAGSTTANIRRIFGELKLRIVVE